MEVRRKSYQDFSSLKSAQKPPQSNFLATSNTRALKGIRIVQNLPFQRKVWFVLIAVCIFTTAFWFTLSFSEHTLVSRNTSSGQEIPNISNTESTEAVFNTAVIYLQRPQRPFHGNHWYHIGEYYISQRDHIQQMLAQHRALHNTPIRHLKLVVHDYRLSDWLSKMSFALIVLACLGHHSESNGSSGGGDIQTIELYAASSLQYHTTHTSTPSSTHTTTYTPSDLHNDTTVTIVEHKQPLFGYYKLPSEAPKFINYAHHRDNNIDRNAIFSDTITPFMPAYIASGVLSWYQYLQVKPHSLSVYCNNRPCREAVYLGSIGAVPIPPVEWFNSYEHASAFRNNALSVCGKQHQTVNNTSTSTTTATTATPRVYNLIMYQRDLNRRFIHLNKVVETLRSRIQSTSHTTTTNTNTHTTTHDNVVWNVEVLRHREDAEPCALINTLNKADILLTAHGFQSTALMFMRPGAVIIEIFPYKYHRTTYLPLARVFGLHYRSIQNTAPTAHSSSGVFANIVSKIDSNRPSTQLLKVISQGACMRDLECRSYARSRDINMPNSHIELVLKTMQEVQTDTLNPYAPLLN